MSDILSCYISLELIDSLFKGSVLAAVRQNLYMANYNICDGPEASNYTLLAESFLKSDCTRMSGTSVAIQLVQSNSDATKTVNSLLVIAESAYPLGGMSPRYISTII